MITFIKVVINKKDSGKSSITLPASVPRAGVEPARVAPLVFETSASTDSAIWAYFPAAKVRIKSELTKVSDKKVKKLCAIRFFSLT